MRLCLFEKLKNWQHPYAIHPGKGGIEPVKLLGRLKSKQNVDLIVQICFNQGTTYAGMTLYPDCASPQTSRLIHLVGALVSWCLPLWWWVV